MVLLKKCWDIGGFFVSFVWNPIEVDRYDLVR